MHPFPITWDSAKKVLHSSKKADIKLVPWYVSVYCYIAFILIPVTLYGVSQTISMSPDQAYSLGEDISVAFKIIGVSVRIVTAMLIVILLVTSTKAFVHRFKITHEVRFELEIFDKLEAEFPRQVRRTHRTVRPKMTILWWTLIFFVVCLAIAPFSFTLIAVFEKLDPGMLVRSVLLVRLRLPLTYSSTP